MQLTAQATALREQFVSQPNWQEMYRLLLQEGKNAPILAAELRNDSNRVQGCEAKVWLRHYVESQGVETQSTPPKVHFEFASDARMVQALIHVALLPLQGQSASDIATFNVSEWMQSCKLEHQLSPSRSNGLAQVVKAAQAVALRQVIPAP